MRALLGSASHYCEALVLKSRTVTPTWLFIDEVWLPSVPCLLMAIEMDFAYRGTSLIRKHLALGPYSRPVPMTLRWSCRGGGELL